MKTNLLLLGICGAMLIACNDKKSESADPASELDKIEAERADKEADQAARYKDSVQKAQIAEQEAFKQDSIDALGIKGYKVKRISGKHKYGGQTTLEYQSLAQVLAEDMADAKKKMLSKEETDESIKRHKDFNKGGRLFLHIDRPTIGAANADNFTVIVKDKDDKEIMREKFESDVPDYDSDGWWNIKSVSIDKRVGMPFFVYVVDDLEDAPFKFEITPIKK